MFRELVARSWAAVPAQCAVCHRWPAQPLCEACVARFAQPVNRCSTCALAVPEGVMRCGACIVHPPPLDACLAAVSYGFPWSDCIAAFKFKAQPGWARSFATLLRSTPWVEPALDTCHSVLPLPLSAQRLRERGFNQSLELARQLSPEKTRADLLLRLRDSAPQHTLDRSARLAGLRDTFAVDPLMALHLRAQRVVLVDDVMTSGASMYAAAQALRAAGAAHITGIVIARTE